MAAVSSEIAGTHFAPPTVVVDPPAAAAGLLGPAVHADVLHVA
ncbi:hypothetical protein [Streptomyces spinoverrucosus]|nr:hypothetical protein [Streptomyces spinoverrucosus]